MATSSEIPETKAIKLERKAQEHRQAVLNQKVTRSTTVGVATDGSEYQSGTSVPIRPRKGRSSKQQERAEAAYEPFGLSIPQSASGVSSKVGNCVEMETIPPLLRKPDQGKSWNHKPLDSTITSLAMDTNQGKIMEFCGNCVNYAETITSSFLGQRIIDAGTVADKRSYEEGESDKLEDGRGRVYESKETKEWRKSVNRDSKSDKKVSTSLSWW